MALHLSRKMLHHLGLRGFATLLRSRIYPGLRQVTILQDVSRARIVHFSSSPGKADGYVTEIQGMAIDIVDVDWQHARALP